MNDTVILYIVLFTLRCVVASICIIKCGWKAFGFMFLYAILTVISPDAPINIPD